MQRLKLFLFLGFFFMGFGLGDFRLALLRCLGHGLLALFVLGVINAHRDELVLYCHDWMLHEHALARAGHDFHEGLVVGFAEAHVIAAVADRLGKAVFAAVHLWHDDCEEGGALRAELAVLGTMVRIAVYAEGFLDIGLFLRQIIFEFDWLFFELKFFWYDFR